MLRGAVGSHYDERVVDAMLAVLADADAAAVADRLIDARDLRPGMVLSRDLLSPRGAILLAAGHVFDAALVRQVGDFAQRENLRLNLYVRQDALALDPAPIAGISRPDGAAPAEPTTPQGTPA